MGRLIRGGNFAAGPNDYFTRSGPEHDAFQRLRVAENTTLISNKFLYDLRTDVFAQKTVSGATIAKRTSQPVVELNTTSTIGSRAVLQSKAPSVYTAGKSQLVKLTGAFGDPIDGVIKRWGCFNDRDGIFIQQSGSDYSVVIRTYSSGTAIDGTHPRSTWDDKLDGTGPSGVNYDLTRPLIFIYDFQWLAVGQVRIGVDVDGFFIPVHTINNAGNLTYSEGVYMCNPNLPVRYEIVNQSAVAGSQMLAICQSVESEGGSSIDLEPYSAYTGLVPASLPQVNNGIQAAVVSIRLASGITGAIVKAFGIDITAFGNAGFCWALAKNPTLNFTPTYSAIGGGSQVERWTATGTISATNVTSVGRVISSGATSSSTRSSVENYSFEETLGTDVDGVSDTYAIIVTPDANSRIFAGIHWGELT